MMEGLSTKHLSNLLEPARSLTNAHTPQEGDIKFRIDPSVEVASGRRDLPLPLEHAQVVRGDPKLLCGFGDVHLALHLREV